MNRKTVIPLTLASLAVLAACSSAEESPADDVAVTEPTPTEAPEGAPAEQETEAQETDDGGDTAADAAGASRDNPAAPGETVAWENYEVTFGETDMDATDWVRQAEADELYGGDLSYTFEPQPGNVYIVAPVTLTYTGEERGEPYLDITVSFVSEDGNVYDEPVSQTAPDDIKRLNEMYPGATEEVHVIQEVPEGTEGVWRIHDTFAMERVEAFFATE